MATESPVSSGMYVYPKRLSSDMSGATVYIAMLSMPILRDSSTANTLSSLPRNIPMTPSKNSLELRSESAPAAMSTGVNTRFASCTRRT